MRRLLALIALGSFFTVPLSAQTHLAKRKPVAPASIEGDVYLLNKGGEVKKGAAGTVGLAIPGPSLETVFRSACAAQHAEARRDTSPTGGTNGDAEAMMAQANADMARIVALENRHREEMFATLIAASANAPTGMNAHFSFANVRPGKYYLLSVMHLGERVYGWVVPVTVESGQSLRIDLDNNNAQLITADLESTEPDHNPLFCGRDGMGQQFPLR
jgi:hypothetical protein